MARFAGRSWGWQVALVAWVALAGWLTPAVATSQPSPPPPTLIVALDDASLPAGCRPAAAAGALARFVTAFNASDQAALAGLFAVGPDFLFARGVMPPGQIHAPFEARAAAPLLAELARDRAAGERLRLLMAQVADTDERAPSQPAATVDWVLTHDGTGPAPEEGLARLDCRTGRIGEWQPTHEGSVWWPCPVPAGWQASTSAPVACTRRTFAPSPAELAGPLPAPRPFPLTIDGIRAALTAWVAAYNARDADAFLALFAEDQPGQLGRYGDCDYAGRHTFLAFRGRAEVRAWIRERWAADADRWTLREVMRGGGQWGSVEHVAELDVVRINRQLSEPRETGAKLQLAAAKDGRGLILRAQFEDCSVWT